MQTNLERSFALGNVQIDALFSLGAPILTRKQKASYLGDTPSLPRFLPFRAGTSILWDGTPTHTFQHSDDTSVRNLSMSY